MTLSLAKAFSALRAVCALACGCGDDGGEESNTVAADTGSAGSQDGVSGSGSVETDSGARAGTDTSGGAADDEYSCAEIKKISDALAAQLGCAEDRQIESLCNALHDMDLCISDWDAFVACVAPLEATNYFCDQGNDEITLKTTWR